jgi:AraC-like DNA-binding protein/mannose-6-phosphate isomerase-like protein (cupin superfamily)
MAFYLADRPQSDSFKVGTRPRLVVACKSDKEPLTLPRVLHKHDDYLELILICEGHGRYKIDGTTYQAAPGDVLVYNAGAIHDERANSDSKLKMYYCAAYQVAFQDLAENQLLPSGQSPVVHSGEQFDQVEALFATLVKQTALGTAQSLEIAQLILPALLLMIRSLSNSQPRPDLVAEPELGRRIKTYLDQHYAADLTLAAIAAEFHLNAYYLAHLFKAQLGYAPMQYRLRRRIGEAQSLLLSTDWPVTEIAARVGYDNPSHFNRQFSKFIGLPPRLYRRKYLKTPPDPLAQEMVNPSP